jgi:hypothetical protein
MQPPAAEVAERPPLDLRIIVSRCAERSADVIARVKPEPGSLPDFVMIGQASRISADGEPEEWKAWLWPKGGEYPPHGQHCDALTRPSCGDIEALPNKRLKAEGRWWS